MTEEDIKAIESRTLVSFNPPGQALLFMDDYGALKNEVRRCWALIERLEATILQLDEGGILRVDVNGRLKLAD